MVEKANKVVSSGIGKRRASARQQGNGGYDDRRTRIIDAASALFREHGYRESTLAQLADAVGIDRASLYYYFGSKEEIFDVLVSDIVKSNRENAQALLTQSGPAAGRLRAFVVELMSSYGEHYPFLFIYLQERMGHVAPSRRAWAEEMRPVNRQFEDAIVGMVEQGFEDGSIRRSGDARVISYGIMGMISWSHRWFNPEVSAHTAREIGETYADVILNGLSTDL